MTTAIGMLKASGFELDAWQGEIVGRAFSFALKPETVYRIEYRPDHRRGRHLHADIPQHQLSQPRPLPIDGSAYYRRRATRMRR